MDQKEWVKKHCKFAAGLPHLPEDQMLINTNKRIVPPTPFSASVNMIQRNLKDATEAVNVKDFPKVEKHLTYIGAWVEELKSYVTEEKNKTMQ